jgi:medium-chain acyl-[acyl-carrier-protein] hydrolase
MSAPCAQPSPWFLRLPDPCSHALRLLCLPHAGSGASWYGAWAGKLGPDVEIVPLQPPGREGRLVEQAHGDMDALMAALTPAVAPLCEGRYAVFGHSMGAHVAFELVRRLRDMRRTLPVCLIVSGARAPHLPPIRPYLFEMHDEELLATIEGRYGTRFEPEMRDLVRLTMPTLRADLRVVETQIHRTAMPLPVPLLVLAGASDASVPLGDARKWERHTSEEFELKLFPGGHFFPVTQGDAVLACLSRTLAHHSAAAA